MRVNFHSGSGYEEIRIDHEKGEIAVIVQLQKSGDVGVKAFRYGSGENAISQLVVGKPREDAINKVTEVQP